MINIPINNSPVTADNPFAKLPVAFSQWSVWSFRDNGRLIKVPFRSRASFSQGGLRRDLALQGAGVVKLAGFHIGEDIRKTKSSRQVHRDQSTQRSSS